MKKTTISAAATIFAICVTGAWLLSDANPPEIETASNTSFENRKALINLQPLAYCAFSQLNMVCMTETLTGGISATYVIMIDEDGNEISREPFCHYYNIGEDDCDSRDIGFDGRLH